MLYTIRVLLGPIIIAGLLAYLLNPAVTKLKTVLKLSHRMSVLIIYVLFLLSLVIILIFVVPILIKQGQSLAHEIQILEPQIKAAVQQPLVFAG